MSTKSFLRVLGSGGLGHHALSRGLRQSRRMFSTTRSSPQHEHRTYFQHDSQQGRAVRANGYAVDTLGRASRSTTSSMIPYVATFLAGACLTYVINTGTVEVKMQELLAQKDMGGDHTSTEQPVGGNAVPAAQGMMLKIKAYDGEERVVDAPTYIERLHTTLVHEQIRRLEEVTTAAEELRQTQSLLDSANESQLKVHKTLFAHLTSSKNKLVVLDDALLESHPIVLPDQTRVPANKAALMRVVDKAGKNRVLILGVDLDYHKDFESVAARFPGDCYDLDEWLCNVADELARGGQNAEEGVAIYLYSNRVIVDVNHETGFRWMTRFKQSDFPSGFPLRQMRLVEKVQDSKSSVDNRVKADIVKIKDDSREKEAP